MPEQDEKKMCDECGERPGKYVDGDRLLCDMCEYKLIHTPKSEEGEEK